MPLRSHALAPICGSVSQCDALRSRLKLWNESGTNRARIGDSSPLRLRSPQHLALTPHCGTRSSLARIDKRRFGGEILKSEENTESNQKRARVNRDSATSAIPGWCVSTRPGISRFRVRCFASPRNDGTGHHCVLATRGGDAWVLNWVASSMAVPSGVGIIILNGTRMRVPATGAKAISMLRWAARYSITGRSGM